MVCGVERCDIRLSLNQAQIFSLLPEALDSHLPGGPLQCLDGGAAARIQVQFDPKAEPRASSRSPASFLEAFKGPTDVSTAPDTPQSLDFEAALEELEKLVERLEQGELTLEQALEQFERGVTLTRNCQEALKQAQQRVDVLLEPSEDASPDPFEPGV